jgi:hypothetical protein
MIHWGCTIFLSRTNISKYIFLKNVNIFQKNTYLWYEINIKSSISWKFDFDEPRGYRNTRSASP